MATEFRHQCQVYKGSPSRQLSAIAEMTCQKLIEGYRCLYLNSPAMVAGLRSTLAALGIDVIRESARTALLLTSDQSHLVGGRFDSDRMLAKLDDALQKALQDRYTGLWAVGDMTWELGFQANFPNLLEYEWRLEEYMRGHSQLCGICQYHADTLPSEALKASIVHESFFINETLSQLNPHYVRAEAPTGLMASHPQFDTFIDRLCQATEGD